MKDIYISGRTIVKPELSKENFRDLFLQHIVTISNQYELHTKESFSIDNIKSVFNSTFIPTPLYGGRLYNHETSFTEKQCEWLSSKNINLSIPLSSLDYCDEYYNDTKKLLEHFKGTNTSLICADDNLAKRIQVEYPSYTLKKSIIGGIKPNKNACNEIKRLLEIYDYITLHPHFNKNDDLLNSLPHKDKLILFIKVNGLGLPQCTMNCYKDLSWDNASLFGSITPNKFHEKHNCSVSIKRRMKTRFFSKEKYKEMGFCLFKIPFM